MEPVGRVAWPVRGGPGDGSSIRRELPASPAWEPPQKKVRNNAFQVPASTFGDRERGANHSRGEDVFSARLSYPLPVHAEEQQLYEGREPFAPFSHDQGLPGYGGQQQDIHPANAYAQESLRAPGRSFDIASQSYVSSPGFPPGSARSTGALFLKTKLCTKFKLGTCTFNERCHFAHGMEDLRKPPVGWESMVASPGQGRRFSGRMGELRKKSSKPCRFFTDGKECPYGDGCTFVHCTGEDVYPASGLGASEGGGLPTHRLKTRMCERWERGEACSYGERCHYAHGFAELQNNSGVSAYGNDRAPADIGVQYPNANLETSSFATQNSNPMNSSPVAVPHHGLFPTASTNAPFNVYATPGRGVQQPAISYTNNPGYWNGTPEQGGFPENQTAGLWRGHHPMADGGYSGYSKDPSSAAQYLPPAQVQQQQQQQQQPVVQSYATGNASTYHQDPKQILKAPHAQDGGNGNVQTEAFGGNGGYYPATYVLNHSN